MQSVNMMKGITSRSMRITPAHRPPSHIIEVTMADESVRRLSTKSALIP
ncbi:hypothetical protein RRSWK_01955 [Rhodopirellula sp. SWK7]|nr:hypothetical protein RRSWK_01955 [Rhodopirellula sp. SWK7]